MNHGRGRSSAASADPRIRRQPVAAGLREGPARTKRQDRHSLADVPYHDLHRSPPKHLPKVIRGGVGVQVACEIESSISSVTCGVGVWCVSGSTRTNTQRHLTLSATIALTWPTQRPGPRLPRTRHVVRAIIATAVRPRRCTPGSARSSRLSHGIAPTTSPRRSCPRMPAGSRASTRPSSRCTPWD